MVFELFVYCFTVQPKSSLLKFMKITTVLMGYNIKLLALLKNVPRCLSFLHLLFSQDFYATIWKLKNLKVNKWPKWTTEKLRRGWVSVHWMTFSSKISPCDLNSKFQELKMCNTDFFANQAENVKFCVYHKIIKHIILIVNATHPYKSNVTMSSFHHIFSILDLKTHFKAIWNYYYLYQSDLTVSSVGDVFVSS